MFPKSYWAITTELRNSSAFMKPSPLQLNHPILSRFVAHLILLLACTTVVEVGNAKADSIDDVTQPPAIPYYDSKPKFGDFIPNAFSDIPDFLRRVDPRDHAKDYLTLGLVSAVLIRYDQDILIASQELARRWRVISTEDSGTGSRLVARTKLGTMNLDLRLPKGINSYFYFIGDGLTTGGIIAGLGAFGSLWDDNRALHTASQLMESSILTGIFVITSKFTFGRQSPNQREKDGGAWHPLPGGKRYLTNISSYDAFPSGHVATAMSTLVILSENYPEKFWIRPVGYGALGLLMFGMLNNGVHWAGDYPLGLAIGYVAGHTVIHNRKPIATNLPTTSQREKFAPWSLLPFSDERGTGLEVTIPFSS